MLGPDSKGFLTLLSPDDGTEDTEFVSLHKYIRNSSTKGTVLIEHLLNNSERFWTPKRTGKIPSQWGRTKERKRKKRNHKRDQQPRTEAEGIHLDTKTWLHPTAWKL